VSHTPEPWRVVGTSIFGKPAHLSLNEAGPLVCRCDVTDSDGQDEPNARRIVACVNALEGIPTEELEQGLIQIGREGT